MPDKFQSPGVSYSENEILPKSNSINTLSIGIVGGATKGPLDLTLITSEVMLNNIFGEEVDTDWGVWAAKKALKNSGKVYFKRVVSSRAKKGTTAKPDGEQETESILFDTKAYDSTLEGVTINVEVKEDKTVFFTATKKGNLLERYRGLSLDKKSPVYIIDFLNAQSDYFTARESTTVPLNADTYAGGTYTIRGCHDGIEGLVDKDYIGENGNGIQAFKSTANVDISTLIVPGRSSKEIIDALEEVCNYRGDVEVIIDPPLGLTPKEANEWADAKGIYTQSSKLQSAYMSTYYPWIEEKHKGKARLTPPSGWMASQWAYNDSIAGPWYAPAGMQDTPRGVLQEATGLEYYMTKEEIDTFYPDGVINPIMKFFGKGIVVWGNRTCKRTPLYEKQSVFCELSIRRLCNYIRKVVTEISYSEIFNPNDPITWKNWKLKVSPRLREIKEQRGLKNFMLVMDESNNPEETQREGHLNGEIYIQPIHAVQWVNIKFTATQDSTIFSEVEEDNN